MSRWQIILWSPEARKRACEWITKAPDGYRVTVQETKRTVPQNDRMWAMLTQISIQLAWHGQRLSPEDWKTVFLAGLNQEMRMVPNINGNGFVTLGRSSSKLSKSEMTELMDLIEAFAAQHSVDLFDQEKASAA